MYDELKHILEDRNVSIHQPRVEKLKSISPKNYPSYLIIEFFYLIIINIQREFQIFASQS